MEIPVRARESSSRTWRTLLRPKFVESLVLVIDLFLIVATGILSSAIYHRETGGNSGNVLPYIGVGVIAAANFMAVMTARRNYHLKRLIQVARQARETVFIWSGIYGLLAVAAFTMKISSDFSRGAVILFFVSGLSALLAWRRLVADFILKSLEIGSFASKKMIVIAERGQIASSRPLNELLRCGFRAVKTCEIAREEVTSPGIAASLRAKLAEVIEVARTESIEDIYLLVRWEHHRIIDGILDSLAVLPISVHLVPDETAARFLNYPVSNIGETWTAELRRTPLTRIELAAKRFFDLALATAAVIALLPLMLVTAILIKLDSRGPVFFLQKRNGFNGQTFDIFKFRTMHVLENDSTVKQATLNDPRVTRLGRWLRKSSIDELPQLLNVIRGEMSLVGPRPHATSHNSEYEKLIANYAFRHHVKPGLTGWAQISGYRGETRYIEQMRQRVEHDLWYINNWSPWLDLRIVLQTVVVALRQDAAY
ncbi:MAG TPA: undecaprenyl-phosphate glucose phosphotransferase [Terracidiphilus sp.]|jgi:Undecaprenyl-phosphate glucose phosphotransferase